ncbi:ATP-binding protein [Agrobacterium rubi]|uniref:histidine kinase n=1 Tax=Agrobacterium rubi TaxID=28099 RepID=A0AAE7RC21_9HYPH|nr:ATP-binding protein [Agrobacterium rubi]NTE88888.1 GAF domain-containing protein [Agrobacterium rubi]NTF04716.1 GAF domain-containing protein [Agrobacterium rubi]NTF39278.1 GAF domain-containing protein [Agrobacterium rubi]OCJ51231.1 histidine kinase [Agrobacterium rubi]QTG02917.1 GAF domain-containing protein [Agrobacterium rubi]
MALHDFSPVPLTSLSKLTDAMARIVRARSWDDVTETIRTSARFLIGCEGIAIIRRDGDLCHYVEEDAIGPLWKGKSFPMMACVSGWAMLNRQTTVICDISKDDRVPYELYEGTFVKALAMAPVGAENPVGVIAAYWAQTYEPSHWEIETLEALASAAASAFETIELIGSLSSDLAQSRRFSSQASEGQGDFSADIARVAAIAAVPTILDVVLRMTGMGFAAVARVTEDRWITCQALDHVGFGLKPGDELPVESTLCNEIRDHRETIVFDDAAEDPVYRDHHTPRVYGLRSYISEPIILSNGQFFGTLCAIDPNPAKIKNPQVLGTFKLFVELIGQHLDSGERLKVAQDMLERERTVAELREQFIAVLGHDLRNPIAAVDAGTARLLKEGWTERSPLVLNLMKASIARMGGLVDNVMDLARARLGGGISLELFEDDLSTTLFHVVDELRVAHPARGIDVNLDIPIPVLVDRFRMAQMLSNLVSNALTHGTDLGAVRIDGAIAQGHLTISVSNQGKPIAPDMLERLFQPFRRGDMRPGMKGLGLGLYIASEIAKAHNGKIDVHSDADETRFTFSMPT